MAFRLAQTEDCANTCSAHTQVRLSIRDRHSIAQFQSACNVSRLAVVACFMCLATTAVYQTVTTTPAVQERMVSPPDLPPKEMYKPLGQLLQQVERGQKFRPVTVKEIAAVRNASMVPLY